jgi:ACR3 family arsenite efflux pump ArsB
MMSNVWTPVFADVVFLPRWTEILPVVLIVAVILLAAGVLIRRIRQKRKDGQDKEEDRK